MSRTPIYGPGTPHPLSTMKTELVWEGKKKSRDPWGEIPA